MERVVNEHSLTKRSRAAAQKREHNLFGNSCENFARLVAYRNRRSDQVFVSALLTIAAGGGACAYYQAQKTEAEM